MATTKQIQISLRLSEDLHEKLTVYANAANLSLNAVVIQSLQKLLEQDDIKRRLSELENEVALLRAKSQ